MTSSSLRFRLFLFLLTSPFVVACSTGSTSSIALSQDEVSSVTVTLFNRLDGGATATNFALPEDAVSNMLVLLAKASPHRPQIPADWAVLGDLKITTNKEILDVILFSGGKELIFEVRNVDKGGKYEAKSLDAFLRLVDDAVLAATGR